MNEIKYYKEKEYPLKWIPVEEMEETPQQTIKRLEQENKELKKQIEAQKGLITVGGKQQYETTMAYDKCKSALEEIRKNINNLPNEPLWQSMAECLDKIQNKINEVLN